MAKKRANGEGSITKRADGKFMGQVSIPNLITGKTNRKTVYGKTQKEVVEKINKLKYELQTGVYTVQSDITIRDWMITWLKEYKENSIKKGTYANYIINTNNHVIPHLGNIKLQDLRSDQIKYKPFIITYSKKVLKILKKMKRKDYLQQQLKESIY